MLSPCIIWMCWIRGFTGLGLIHHKVRVPVQMDQGPRHCHLHMCHGEKGPTVAMGWQRLALNVPVVPASSLYNQAVALLAAACARISSGHCFKWLLCSKSSPASPSGNAPWDREHPRPLTGWLVPAGQEEWAQVACAEGNKQPAES